MTETGTTDLLQIETPESVAFDFELANIGSRGLALVLDTLLVGLIILGEALVTGGLVYLVFRFAPQDFRTVSNWLAALLIVMVFLTAWGYFVVGEVAGNGRTPGKRALKLRVVRDDGSRVGAADSMIRNVLRIADALPGNYAVGMASVLLSSRRKRLGDMAAGTVVVREAERVVIDLEPGRSPEAEALAREYLERREGLTPAARMQVSAEVLRALGERPGEGWDEPTVAGRIADLVGAR